VLVAGQLLTQSDYTRCCINTVVLLRISTQLLETCRGFEWTYHRRNCASSWLPTRINFGNYILFHTPGITVLKKCIYVNLK